MSYRFWMGFRTIKSQGDAMQFANEVVNNLMQSENVTWMLKEQIRYIPYTYTGYKRIVDENEHAKYMLDSLVEKTMYNLFTIRFVYFYEANLLAIVGDVYPDSIKKLFNFVYFQNSCDQDYERAEWAGVEYFNTIFDKNTSLTKEQILSQMDEVSRECYKDNGDELDIGYQQRSMTYDEIYKKLNLEDWLYKGKGDRFTPFALCGIYENADAMKLANKAQKIVNETNFSNY